MFSFPRDISLTLRVTGIILTGIILIYSEYKKRREQAPPYVMFKCYDIVRPHLTPLSFPRDISLTLNMTMLYARITRRGRHHDDPLFLSFWRSELKTLLARSF